MVFHVLNRGVARMQLFDNAAEYQAFEQILGMKTGQVHYWQDRCFGSLPMLPKTDLSRSPPMLPQTDPSRLPPDLSRLTLLSRLPLPQLHQPWPWSGLAPSVRRRALPRGDRAGKSVYDFPLASLLATAEGFLPMAQIQPLSNSSIT